MATRRAPLSRPLSFIPVHSRTRVRNVRTPHAVLIRPSSPHRRPRSLAYARSHPPPPTSPPFHAPASAPSHRSNIRSCSTPKSPMLVPSPPAPPPAPPPPAAEAHPLDRHTSRLPPLRSQPAVLLSTHLPSTHSESAQPSTPSSPNPASSPTPTSPLRTASPQPSSHSAIEPQPCSSSAFTPHSSPAPAPPRLSPQPPTDRLRFRPGDLVLCRYYNYPVWPAVVAITHQPASRGRYFTMRPTRAGDDAVMAYWVTFAGETVGGWIRTDCIVPYHPAYAAQIESRSNVAIYRDCRRAMRVAEQHYNKSPSRFGFQQQDMLRILHLSSIPLNQFVDMKSQDTEADVESEPPRYANEQTSYVQPTSESTRAHSEIHPVQTPPPQRFGGRVLRPRAVKVESQPLPRRVLPPRKSKSRTLHGKAFSRYDDQQKTADDAAPPTPKKCEPREIKVTTANAATAPTARRRPISTKAAAPKAQNARASLPPSSRKTDTALVLAPVACRQRGRARKRPLLGQKQPVSSRITKPEPTVSSQVVVKMEPEDALTHIPAQLSSWRQFRRKRRGRHRKVAPSPEPAVSEVREKPTQVLDRMQRRIRRQEKQILLLSQQHRSNNTGASPSAGHSALPSISVLTKTTDPKTIRAQTERFVQKLLNFQRLSVQLAVEAERFQEAQKNCEAAWKSVVEEGRATEQQAMELEAFIAKLPGLTQFLRSVRM